MSNRMDQVVAAAVRQGFSVTQTRTGTWVFRKGLATLTWEATPTTPSEWMHLLRTLRGAGLGFPMYRGNYRHR